MQADKLGVGYSAAPSTSGESQQEKEYELTKYKFLPNKLPPFRQMFYQLCDIEVPEVQAIVNKNNGQVCFS